MMRLRTFMILLIIAAVFIAGCKKEAVEVGAGAFIGGNEGLSLSFSENTPPDQVSEDDLFSINVQIQNVGEYDIEKTSDVAVNIEGINPGDFSKDLSFFKKNIEEPLEAVQKDATGRIIEGSRTDVTFEDLEYKPDVIGQITLPIRANVCYKYKTTALTKMCILKDLLDIEGTEVCNPNRATMPENSGAPVKVVNLQESVAGRNKITLVFTVKHAGTGRAVKADSQCSEDFKDEGLVKVKVDTGEANLACTGFSKGSGSEGFVRLGGNGEATVRCAQQLPALRGDSEKAVRIELDYDYEQFIEKPIKIVESID